MPSEKILVNNVKKNTEEENISQGIVFVNSPIDNVSSDIIGFAKSAENIREAINSGAKTIAVTSPFGAGKSSLSSILEQLMMEDEKNKFVRISLWPQMHTSRNNDEEAKVMELHRYFIYQLVKKINPLKAEYVSKQLDGKYGLWKVDTDNIASAISLIFAAAFFVFSYISGKFFEAAEELAFGITYGVAGTVSLFIAIFIFVLLLWKSEFLFSLRKSEGERKTTSSDVIAAYRKYVLKSKDAEHYVVVIEDLDRTDENEVVLIFLKELRKYYVEDEKNKITFIVNIKPEYAIHKDEAEHEKDSRETLYSKLFDYTLSLQIINFTDYDVVLNSLLEEQSEEIKKLLDIEAVSLTDIPELEWIIRGQNISIRVIKDRLNKAFSLYETLKDKFPDSKPEFKKCTAAAYITSAFEKDFYNTDHEAYGRLAEAFICGSLEDGINSFIANEASGDYKNAVKELVEARLIDDEYHMYYYNYPQYGRIYYSDELAVRNAILYNSVSNNLTQLIERAKDRKSDIFEQSFKRLENLGIKMPEAVIDNETLYKEALINYPQGIYQWMRQLDYRETAEAASIRKIMNLLSYDMPRKVYSKGNASSYAEIWSSECSEQMLLKLRAQLCELFPQEVTWYSALFKTPHAIIGEAEISKIKLTDALKLLDKESDMFGVETTSFIVEKYRTALAEDNIDNLVEEYIRDAYEFEPKAATIDDLINYMIISKQIPRDFELEVVSVAKSNYAIFQNYQKLILSLDANLLSIQTLESICELDHFEDYSEEIADRLFKEGKNIESILIRVAGNFEIDFSSDVVCKTLEDNLNFILTSHKELFVRLREKLTLCNASIIQRYAFAFGDDCPVITSIELSNIGNKFVDIEIIMMIPPTLVDAKSVDYIVQFLNRKWHKNNEAFDLIMDISKWEPEYANEAFYKLDFEKCFQYFSFATKKKNKIKEEYVDILSLNSISGQLEYMASTFWIDAHFDRNILSGIKGDDKLEKQYISIINSANPKSYTNNTISNVVGLSKIYALCEEFAEKLYSAKKYEHYVVTTTLRINRFDVAPDAKGESLWSIYVKIFSEGKYKNIQGYMEKNRQFLSEIVMRGYYEGMPENIRAKLSCVYQTKESIENVMTYGNNFAVRYLSEIDGFINREAAVAFMEIVESNNAVIASDNVYNNTYGKLEDGRLKGKYTHLRKIKGYMK